MAEQHLYAALERATEATPGCALRLKEAEIGEPADFSALGPAPPMMPGVRTEEDKIVHDFDPAKMGGRGRGRRPSGPG